MRNRLILLFVAVVLALCVSEGLFRAAVFFKTPRGLLFDPELVFSFAPESTVYDLKLNNIGALGDDVVPRVSMDGPLRVFLYGGSTSYSRQYVDSLRDNLQTKLNRECLVASFGRPRYTSAQAKVLAERTFKAYQPDVAVLYLGINDTIFDTFWWVNGAPDVGFLNWRDRWPPLLFQGIRYHLIEKRLRSKPWFPDKTLRSERILGENIESIADIADREGVRLVLSEFALAIPTDDGSLASAVHNQEPVMRHFWGNVDSTVRAVRAHNLVIKRIAAQRHLECAPVDGMIPKSSRYFNDICHLTTAGNEILADTIASAVVEALSQHRTDADRSID